MIQARTTTNITQDDVPMLLDQMTDAVRQSVLPLPGVSVPELLQCLVDRGILAYPPPPAAEQPHDTESLLDQASDVWNTLARLTVEGEGNDTRSKAMRESAIIANEELHHRLAIIQGALRLIHQTEQAAPGRDPGLESRLGHLRSGKTWTMLRLRPMQRKLQQNRLDSDETALNIAASRHELDVSRASRKLTEEETFRIRQAVRAIDEAGLDGARRELSATTRVFRDFIQDTADNALRATSRMLELESGLEDDIEAMEASLDQTRSAARHLVHQIGEPQAKLDELATLRIVVARLADTAQT
ncbi:hypothetical protein BFW01_g1682 [Lasiodiplodia theobromae]|nr:hypothetical protein BFW01_g1682 [Lasiodiplodia theobromae]